MRLGGAWQATSDLDTWTRCSWGGSWQTTSNLRVRRCLSDHHTGIVELTVVVWIAEDRDQQLLGEELIVILDVQMRSRHLF